MTLRNWAQEQIDAEVSRCADDWNIGEIHMDRMANALHDFLMRHSIDPNKVGIVLRAKDEETQAQLEIAMNNDLKLHMWIAVGIPDATRLKINGISIVIASLDTSKRAF